MNTRRDIRVLQLIATNDPGGAETVVRELCLLFNGDPIRTNVALAGNGWLERELRRASVGYKAFRYDPFIDVAFIKELSKYMREWKTDIVQCHMSQMNILGAFIGRLLRVPVVMTIHGITNDFDSFRQILFYKFATRICDRIVVVSNHLKKKFSQHVGPSRQKLQVIYNGVNADKFKRAENIRKKTDRQRVSVVAVGSLVPVKDYHTLIRSCAILRAKGCNLRLDIVGEGPERERLSDEIRRLGAEDYVRLVGFRDNIPEILASSDIYAISSRHEGLSISTIEAMCAGLPVVATKCGGPEEIVVENETGFLVSVGDEKALANAIQTFIRNRNLRDQFGNRGQERSRDMFSLGRMREDYVNLYSQFWENSSRIGLKRAVE